jgi:hypothetical protein
VDRHHHAVQEPQVTPRRIAARNDLVIAAVTERAKERGVQVVTHHAAPTGESTLCGRHGALKLVDAVEYLTERWPKHWPSTDTRKVCSACITAAEMLWRRVDHEPNVDLLNASIDCKRLARELTPMLADVKEALASLGYPTNSERGGGGASDDTGHDAATAHDLTAWVEDVRDAKRDLLRGVRRLDVLLGRRRVREEPTKGQMCGQTQVLMDADELEGWTPDYQCGRYGTRGNGLCDRCGKRWDRRLVAA